MKIMINIEPNLVLEKAPLTGARIAYLLRIEDVFTNAIIKNELTPIQVGNGIVCNGLFNHEDKTYIVADKRMTFLRA